MLTERKTLNLVDEIVDLLENAMVTRSELKNILSGAHNNYACRLAIQNMIQKNEGS